MKPVEVLASGLASRRLPAGAVLFPPLATGNGAFAAATASAEAVFIAMFLIGANVIEFASDGTSALVGAATAVVAFAVTAYGLSRRANRRRRVQ